MIAVRLAKADWDNLYSLGNVWMSVLLRSATEQDNARHALIVLELLTSGARFMEELERIGATDARVDSGE
jgi:hypothetical protein